MHQEYHYIYSIKFKDFPHIYYGSRSSSCLPEEDISYVGSPKAFKDFWTDKTPIKTILKTFDTRLEANEAENFLINWQWNSTDEGRKYSLNGCILNKFFNIKGVKHGKEFGEKVARRCEQPFTLFSPEGNLIEGVNLTHFAEERDLNAAHLWHVVRGKNFHYCGYTASFQTHLLYKEAVEMRGIHKNGSYLCVQWKEEGTKKAKCFKILEDTKIFRDKLELKLERPFKILVKNWQEKLNSQLLKQN